MQSCIPLVIDDAAGMIQKYLTWFFSSVTSKPTGRRSFLFTERFFNTDYYVVSATSLVHLCVVLVSLEADGKVLVVKDKSEWASVFHEVTSAKYKDPPRPPSPINKRIDETLEDMSCSHSAGTASSHSSSVRKNETSNNTLNLCLSVCFSYLLPLLRDDIALP
jgi:hypothetical protein